MTWLSIIAAPLVLTAAFLVLALPSAWWWKRRGGNPASAEFGLAITGIFVALLLIALPILEATYP